MNKEHIIKFRVSELEKKEIQKRADKSGKSLSEYCRASALEKTVFSFTEEEKNIFRGYGRNLNQTLKILYENTGWWNIDNLILDTEKAIKFLTKLRKLW